MLRVPIIYFILFETFALLMFSLYLMFLQTLVLMHIITSLFHIIPLFLLTIILCLQYCIMHIIIMLALHLLLLLWVLLPQYHLVLSLFTNFLSLNRFLICIIILILFSTCISCITTSTKFSQLCSTFISESFFISEPFFTCSFASVFSYFFFKNFTYCHTHPCSSFEA